MIVLTLLDRQAERAAALARRIDDSGGRDQAAFVELRRLVGAEMLSRGSMEIATKAIELLGSQPGVTRWLQLAVEHGGQFFYLEDCVLAAIVAPVSVSLSIGPGAACSIREGDLNELSLLAERTKMISGAQHVVFDRHMYTGEDLMAAGPRAIKDHLVALAKDGPDIEQPLATPVELEVSGSSIWRIVHFLGVATHAPGDQLTLEDGPTASAMAKLAVHAAFAIGSSPAIHWWNTDVSYEAQNHNVSYLFGGLRAGQFVQQGHDLKNFLARLHVETREVELLYASDPANRCVRLLGLSAWLAAEYVWGVLLEDPRLDFQRVFSQHLGQLAPGFKRYREIGLGSYERIANERGMRKERVEQ